MVRSPAPSGPTRTSTRRSRRSPARSSDSLRRRPRPRSYSATGTPKFSATLAILGSTDGEDSAGDPGRPAHGGARTCRAVRTRARRAPPRCRTNGTRSWPSDCAAMARLLRANAAVGFENNALWQERDISHSSAERVVLPDSTILAFYMLRTTTRILRGLEVHEDRMLENLNSGRRHRLLGPRPARARGERHGPRRRLQRGPGRGDAGLAG